MTDAARAAPSPSGSPVVDLAAVDLTASRSQQSCCSPPARRLGYGLFDRPTIAIDADREGRNIDSTPRIARPISKDLCFAPTCEMAIRSRVPRLIGSGDPPTIPRRIRPININPVDSQPLCISVRQRPCAEHREVGGPLLTNCDASRSIPAIHRIVSLRAPLAHPAPHSKQTSGLTPMRATMRAGDFLHEASARLSMSSFQGIPIDDPFIPAFTANEAGANPLTAFADSEAIGINDNKTSKSLTRDDVGAKLGLHREPPTLGVTPLAGANGAGALLCAYYSRSAVHNAA